MALVRPLSSRRRPQKLFFSLIDGKPGIGPACVRAILWAASWGYALGVMCNRALYAWGVKEVTRLPVEVIGVGNLSMGGTGKTLAVQMLAQQAVAEGKRVAILSRGYRGASREQVGVVSTPEGLCLTMHEAGDEPFLLAARLPGVPVLVGKDRRLTGRYALEHFGSELLILDDSFQYLKLYKDHEIVLLDALQPATRDYVLPRGVYREPWAHLARAHEIWITHARLASPARVQALTAAVHRCAPRMPLRFFEHSPTSLHTIDGVQDSLALLQGRRVLALSSLGNPQQFETMLTTLGAEVTPCRYPDHHPYSVEDIAVIADRVTPEMLVVTTAKDATRLPAPLPFTTWVVEVELEEVGLADTSTPR